MKKSIKYIDIHGHVNFPEYDADREEVIARASESGVGMITVGTDIESSKRAIELAETHDNMWAVVGIHPTEIVESRKYRVEIQEKNDSELEQSEFQDLRRLALHPKVVAIGECGLDYFHTNEADIPAQIEAFERHISIANEAKKPLMLHVRNGKKKGDTTVIGGDAYKDALNILKKSTKVPFNFHFFAGTIEDMKEIFVQGGTVSFTGVLTFTHDYDELIKQAPLESIMSETDCPYVSPVPHRGKRNEPAFVIEVAKAIARIRGEDEDKIRMVLLENARKFFSLSI
jgi:TatD DNase family protein